jgi:hypothetical protein
MNMTDYLYRVRIIAYPDGACEPMHHPASECAGDHWVPVPGWSPVGWKPEGNYVQILGTSQFVWPTTNKLYRSRSTAKKRAQLLESFGATVVIERSSKITWPEADEDRSDATARSDGRQVVIPIRRDTREQSDLNGKRNQFMRPEGGAAEHPRRTSSVTSSHNLDHDRVVDDAPKTRPATNFEALRRVLLGSSTDLGNWR